MLGWPEDTHFAAIMDGVRGVIDLVLMMLLRDS